MPVRSPWRSTTRSGRKWSGTIAGDDTILVICSDSGTAEIVRAKLIQLLEN